MNYFSILIIYLLYLILLCYLFLLATIFAALSSVISFLNSFPSFFFPKSFDFFILISILQYSILYHCLLFRFISISRNNFIYGSLLDLLILFVFVSDFSTTTLSFLVILTISSWNFQFYCVP